MHGRWAAVLGTLAAIVLAVGCQRLPPVLDDGESAQRSGETTARTDTGDARPRRKPEVPGTSDDRPASDKRSESPAPPPRPTARPDVMPMDLGRLEGRTQEAAQRLLGTPDTRGESPPATVWTYRQGPCRLKLFFYYDLSAGTRRALTVELVPGSRAAGARAACLVAFAQRTRGRAAQSSAS